jgi:cathepsin X
MRIVLGAASVGIVLGKSIQDIRGGFRQATDRKENLGDHGLRASDIYHELPSSIDWRMDANGHNMLTKNRNQHIPSYCGSCWAHSSTTALSDRINIVSGKIRQTGLSMQVVLNCDKYDGGCHGGDPLTAYQFIHEAGGIPDDTCQLYSATGHDTGRSCEDIDICVTCDERGCFPQDTYPVWTIDTYGLVNGTEAMMAELLRGPIACSIAVTDEFFILNDFSIFEDKTGSTDLDHSISVVGYGEENGVPFWIGRNSWGEYWGESGFFRVVRGQNNLGIESNCQFAVPGNHGEPVMRGKKSGIPRRTPSISSLHEWDVRDMNESVHESVPMTDLPSSYDFRNVSSVQSYWTEDKNENAGNYCGSGWAQAVTSALSDRLAFVNKGVWPPVNLSPQVLINCHSGGSCLGGNPLAAYAAIAASGLVDSTCQAYAAKDPTDWATCDEIHQCEECFAGDTDATFWPGTCHVQSKHKTWRISSYGTIAPGDANAMKTEIFAHGPITCGIFANTAFLHYSGGYVIEHNAPNPWVVNHVVEVAGWGVDKHGEEFWIARNSWGTFWGEFGWFRIRMGRKNLNLEKSCSFGRIDEGQEDGMVDIEFE